jgi:hypothetical protein
MVGRQRSWRSDHCFGFHLLDQEQNSPQQFNYKQNDRNLPNQENRKPCFSRLTYLPKNTTYNVRHQKPRVCHLTRCGLGDKKCRWILCQLHGCWLCPTGGRWLWIRNYCYRTDLSPGSQIARCMQDSSYSFCGSPKGDRPQQTGTCASCLEPHYNLLVMPWPHCNARGVVSRF